MRTLHEHRVYASDYSGGISARPIYQRALDLVRQQNLTGPLLDFGSGKGQFIQLLLDTGYPGPIAGADLMARPPNLPETVYWIQGDLNDPLLLADSSFDLITCTEVIAHLENPRFLFREFHRLLRPGGTVILTSPNLESLRSYAGLLTGGHFAAFRGIAYPALITVLLRTDFTRICAESGFVPPAFSYTGDGLMPKLHLSWQRLSFGLLKGRLFSDNLALITRKN